ncbi:MAG: ATP-binding protein [Candidatus Flexifilum sp.]
MDDTTLAALWHQPEGERVEWKPSLSQSDSIYRTICAFANDLAGSKQEGVIFVGRNDDGSCSGVALDDRSIREFVEHIRASGSILPLPDVHFRQIELDGCHVLALIVKPSASTPVQYGQTVWVRIGPTTRKANPVEITALAAKRTSRTFDARAASGASIADLDLFYLQEEYIPNAVSQDVLRENNRTLQEQLAALRILTPDYQPTNLGILIAGKDARRFIPGAYVQFLRIDGTDLADPVKDSKEISGRIADVLRQTFDKVSANIEIAITVDAEGRRIERPTYPFLALREVIANALVHRDYETANAPTRIIWFDDRIEINNPGGPYGMVTDQNFGQPHVTDYRNPELAAALKYLGFVERFGAGIAKAQRLLEKNGNPKLEFEPRRVENYVLAIVRAS